MQRVLEYFQIPLINQMRQKFLMGKKEKHRRPLISQKFLRNLTEVNQPQKSFQIKQMTANLIRGNMEEIKERELHLKTRWMLI